MSGIWKDSNTSCVSGKVTILQCLPSGKTATPAVLVSRLLFSSVWYLERQQHQLCECQCYYSPVSGIWKDSNTSCVSVNVTILQCLVSGKTATPAVRVAMLLFSSVWYLERQQHQLCECQSYYSPMSGIWKDSNTSCVSVKVTILQCLVSGKTATPAVLVSRLLFSSVWYLERQQHQLCEWQSYYSPVSAIWKDSNTSCVSVKVTILQCLVSGKTATPAV